MARFRRVQIEPEGARWLFWEAPCAARGKGGQFPSIMSVATMRKQPTGPVKQFSVFTPNRLGRLHTLTTLLASRNALPDDFSRIIGLIEAGRIDTDPWITHRVPFDDLAGVFPSFTKVETGVIKAIVEL